MNQETIELDLDGKVVPVPREVVSALAAAAAGRAGISSRHRELSLVLGHALQTRRARLGREELRALCAVLEEEHAEGFGPVAAEIARSVA
jgi:hypothetical protein